MTYWLIIMSEENYRYTIENGIYGLPRSSSWLKESIKSGDRLVVYIGKSNCSELCQSFTAVLEVAGDWRESSEPTWPDEKREGKVLYPWVVNVKPIAVGRVNFNDIKDELPNDLSKGIDLRAYRRELPSNVGELIEERLRNSSNMDDCEVIRRIHGNDTINNARRILEDNHALLIIGPPGTGKTTLARCLAHELSAESIEITVHGWFSRMDLIGGYVLQGGNTTWRDGIVLRAIKNGRKTLILLDEINRGEPEKFLAELFTALSSPDRKMSVPNMDAHDIMMAFFGNPFSIIWSFRKWREEGEEYVWGLRNTDKNILKKLKKYKDEGRRIFAGVFFYGRTYINNEMRRALAIFGEITDINTESNKSIAKTYMLSEDYSLIVKIRPLAYLNILNKNNDIFIVNTKVNTENTNAQRRFSDYSDEEMKEIVNNEDYKVYIKITDENNLNKIPMLMDTLNKPIPLNYALGRWDKTISVDEFLEELRSSGLYEITEEGKKYLSEAYLSTSYSLDNIYIVATANTADVGVLGSLGFALQRRFKAVRLEAGRDYVVKALDVFGYGEFKEEISRLWDALEECLKGRIEDYTNYMPGWAYFVDYARLRKSGFSDDEAFRAVFNIYVERFGCNAGGSTNESQPR